MRLDRLVMEHYPDVSRSLLQSWIEDGRVQVNGVVVKKAAAKVAEDAVLVVDVPPVRESGVASQDIPIDVLYEDADIIVINKAAGMVVHPANGNRDGTLVNALLYHCDDLSGIGGEERPGIVHRLDKGTTGVMVVAKNDHAHQSLSAQFKDRVVQKEYLAIVMGKLPYKSGVVDLPIGRHKTNRQKMAVAKSGPARAAWTQYEVIKLAPPYYLVKVKIATGRTHQIRVHMAHIHAPLIGDEIYGGRPAGGVPFGRPALHSHRLSLVHPTSGERMQFEAPIPADFQEWIAKLFVD